MNYRSTRPAAGGQQETRSAEGREGGHLGPPVLWDQSAQSPCAAVSPADSQLKVWMSKYGWSTDESGQIFICSQEESIKPKNIVEKIDFDSEWWPEASGCRPEEVPFDRPGLGPQRTQVNRFWFKARKLASARLP